MVYYLHVPILLLLIIVHDKIIMSIGTWRTTRENSATTRVVWDACDTQFYKKNLKFIFLFFSLPCSVLLELGVLGGITSV
jgi:maltodextrin utilization protein YvdJ